LALSGDGMVTQYMCRKECKCSPKGIQNLAEWAGEEQEDFLNQDLYYFTGEISNFYECYKQLVEDEVIGAE